MRRLPDSADSTRRKNDGEKKNCAASSCICCSSLVCLYFVYTENNVNISHVLFNLQKRERRRRKKKLRLKIQILFFCQTVIYSLLVLGYTEMVRDCRAEMRLKLLSGGFVFIHGHHRDHFRIMYYYCEVDKIRDGVTLYAALRSCFVFQQIRIREFIVWGEMKRRAHMLTATRGKKGDEDEIRVQTSRRKTNAVEGYSLVG